MKRKNLQVPDTVMAAVLLTTGTVRGQSSPVFLSLGAGVPEHINAGPGVSIKQFQAGLTFGTIPYPGDKSFSSGLYAAWHFAGSSKHTEIKPWLGSPGFTYLSDRNEFYSDKWTYLSLRFGLGSSFSPNVALALDGGIMFQTSYSSVGLQPAADWGPGYGPPSVLPAGKLKFIFRIPARESEKVSG
ncbi:MAG: hypothetical protein WAV93_09045 [Bacteroidales bacterium]